MFNCKSSVGLTVVLGVLWLLMKHLVGRKYYQ